MQLYKTYLCLLVLAVVLAGPAHAAPASELAVRQAALSAITALAQQELNEVARSLATIRYTGEVQALDWPRMQPLLAHFREWAVPCAVWYAKPDGTYYTVDMGLMEAKLSDRSYFPRLLDGENVLGDVVVSRSANRLSAIVAVPILKDGAMVGALGASVFIDDLQQQLAQELMLPENMLLLVADRAGKPLCSAGGDSATAAAVAAGGEALDAACRQMVDDVAGQLSLELGGQAWEFVFDTSQALGWHFALGLLPQ